MDRAGFQRPFSTLLAPGVVVVVRGKTADQPTSTGRAPFTYRKFIGILISRLFAHSRHSVYRPFTVLEKSAASLRSASFCKFLPSACSATYSIDRVLLPDTPSALFLSLSLSWIQRVLASEYKASEAGFYLRVVVF